MKGLKLGMIGLRSRRMIDSLRKEAICLNDLPATYTGGTSKFDDYANAIIGPNGRRRRLVSVSPTIRDACDRIEPTRTNILAPGTSEHFALWTNVAVAIVADGVATAPDGTLTASTIQDNDAGSFSGVRQLFTVANDSLSHCFAISVKKTTGGTAATIGVSLLLSGGTGVTINARVNTDTGASNVSTLAVEDRGTFWRVYAKITNNTTGNTTLALTVYPAVGPYQAAPVSAGDAATAVGSATFFAADLQKAEWPSSYISNRNLLLQTYILANAAWGKGVGYTVTDGLLDRFGGTTASRVVYAGGSGGTVLAQSRAITGGTANKSFTMSFWYKSTSGTTQNFRADNVQGGVIDSYQILAATSVWQKCVFTVTNGASAGTGNQGFNLQSVVADSAYDITISDAQLEPGTAASAYWANTTAVGLRAADALTALLASLIDTRRNLILFSEQFDNAAWTANTGGVASIPTVTANAGADPNGNAYADRIVFALNGGVSGADISRITQSYTCVVGQLFTHSFWMKSNTGATYTIAMRIDAGSTVTQTNITVTPTWTRFTVSAVAASTTVGIFQFFLRGAASTSDSADVLVAQAQAIQGADPGIAGYVATAGTAQTANVTGLSIIAGTLIAVVKPIGWTGDQDGSTFWHIARDADASSDIAIRRANATDITGIRSDSGGSEASNITHGLTAGVSRTLALSWGPNGVTSYANGVAGAADTTLATPFNQVTSLAIGWNPAAANNEFSGDVLLYLIPRVLSAAELTAFNYAA